jgi:hypothetical protein
MLPLPETFYKKYYAKNVNQLQLTVQANNKNVH